MRQESGKEKGKGQQDCVLQRTHQEGTTMVRLFTYIMTDDSGSAPNPFNGMCTLAICKPAIRRTANVGDWVAGFASVNAEHGIGRKLIYAMKVTQKETMQDYDTLSRRMWPHRIPNVQSWHMPDRLGDSIYDFANLNAYGLPAVRQGAHTEDHRPTDLGGRNVLISTHFYYFGSSAIELPKDLREICPVTQGHRSTLNSGHVEHFVDWIESVSEPGQRGWPAHVLNWKHGFACNVCAPAPNDEEEEI